MDSYNKLFILLKTADILGIFNIANIFDTILGKSDYINIFCKKPFFNSFSNSNLRS